MVSFELFLGAGCSHRAAGKPFVALIQYSLGVKQENTCDFSMILLAAPSPHLSERRPLIRVLEAYTNA